VCRPIDWLKLSIGLVIAVGIFASFLWKGNKAESVVLFFINCGDYELNKISSLTIQFAFCVVKSDHKITLPGLSQFSTAGMLLVATLEMGGTLLVATLEMGPALIMVPTAGASSAIAMLFVAMSAASFGFEL